MYPGSKWSEEYNWVCHVTWPVPAGYTDYLYETLGPTQRKNAVLSVPTKAKGAVELVTEKGSSNWLTVIPLKELDYNLNKKEFRDAIKLLYD